MKAQILDGKIVALKIQKRLKQEIQQLQIKYQARPKLVSLQIKNNEGTDSYIKVQKELAHSLGINYKLYLLDKAAEDELIKKIRDFNKDENITAIIILLPLPEQIQTLRILKEVSWKKDVEGLHPTNLGRLLYRDSRIAKHHHDYHDFAVPCTVSAVMELLNSAGLKTERDFKGKDIVIVGHSEIVGKPLASLLLDKLATVTVCHVGTKNLKEYIEKAEVLISATGKPNLIKGRWIKNGAIVIDVGMSKVGNKITGDVEFEEAKKHASFITPVPGGVGPLTVTMLMNNVVKLFKLQKK